MKMGIVGFGDHIHGGWDGDHIHGDGDEGHGDGDGEREQDENFLAQVDLSPESRGKPALKRTTGDFRRSFQIIFCNSASYSV